ncbi:ANK-REP-region domain-containing protein [Favolaschia claudopus]|uniref:ANK-REP-region domain-containing protein n=1 Tax=Favolaschia claudopus TaxID=2862362 RepID=A0AAW0EDL4_9AGAR
MAILVDLPPELVLHIVSFSTRLTTLYEKNLLPRFEWDHLTKLIPDLPSINALSQADSYLHCTLNDSLYDLCAMNKILGRLSFLYAAKLELADVLERLAAAGVDVDFEVCFERRCCTLLDLASAMNLRVTVLKLLQIYGTDMAAKVHARDYFSNLSPLDYAACRGNLDVVRMLAPIPNPPPSSSEISWSPTQHLSIALIQAVKGGHRAVCEYLLSQGADVNYIDYSDHYRECSSPLFHATICAEFDLQITQLLLSAGANPNIAEGAILLGAARSSRRLDMLEALFAGGMDLHVRDRFYQHNVFEGCRDVTAMRFFLEHGVDPNVRNREGRTPLHYVYSLVDLDRAHQLGDLLLQFGALPDITDKEGITPIDILHRKAF